MINTFGKSNSETEEMLLSHIATAAINMTKIRIFYFKKSIVLDYFTWVH